MKFFNVASIILVPLVFATLTRLIFGIEALESIYGVMTFAFLVGVPVGIGVLTVYFSPMEKAENTTYAFFIPWLSVLFFFIVTFFLNLEGWGCWAMALPILLLFSSVGGILGRLLKIKKRKNNKTYISIILLLPLVISPIEQLIGKIPGTYKAYTSIDIKAPAEVIWANVTRVKEIPAAEHKGTITRFLNFPRPIKAELNYEGVGASRSAIFSGGLVFHETVLSYEHLRKMEFSIKALPYEIPSTTLDEHIVIGGKYFDVLNGTYELEKLTADTYRLHLYSHFKLSTSFNFYASWWASWIMRDIQNNILQIEKERSEHQ